MTMWCGLSLTSVLSSVAIRMCQSAKRIVRLSEIRWPQTIGSRAFFRYPKSLIDDQKAQHLPRCGTRPPSTLRLALAANSLLNPFHSSLSSAKVSLCELGSNANGNKADYQPHDGQRTPILPRPGAAARAARHRQQQFRDQINQSEQKRD